MIITVCSLTEGHLQEYHPEGLWRPLHCIIAGGENITPAKLSVALGRVTIGPIFALATRIPPIASHSDAPR